MKNKAKKINKENLSEFVSTLKLYVDIIFAEPTKKMQLVKVKSKYNRK